MNTCIRAEREADRAAIEHVHRSAFGGEVEARLVEALRDRFSEVSLVAEVDGAVVGHILFSPVAITSQARTIDALALAPIAVLASYQRQGIGGQLVKAGLEACRAHGHKIVVVLGHPDFYPRFGFSAELARPLVSPFGGDDAWMACELVPGALTGIQGQVEFAPPFRDLE